MDTDRGVLAGVEDHDTDYTARAYCSCLNMLELCLVLSIFKQNMPWVSFYRTWTNRKGIESLRQDAEDIVEGLGLLKQVKGLDGTATKKQKAWPKALLDLQVL